MSATSLVGTWVSRRCTHSARSTITLYMCDDAEIHTLVADRSAAERASDLPDRAATIKNVFSRGPSSEAEDLIALAQQADTTSLKSDAVESDICWLIYTGGTTGGPRA